MAMVELTWTDPQPHRPALDVLVRLVALTDTAQEEGSLERFLMTRGPDGVWAWAGELPDDLRTAYHLCPVRDAALRGSTVSDDRWYEVIAQGVPNPVETDTLPAGSVLGAVDQPASVLSMPGAIPQPWVVARPDAVLSSIARHEWPDGTVVSVQSPLQLDARPTALVVVFDGTSMQAIGMPTVVDNLQADEVIGPVTTVYVDSIRGAAPRGPSRVASLSEGAGLESFADALTAFLDTHADVDPQADRRVVAGHSLGGLAALHLATVCPDVFGAAAAGSAALWWPGSVTQLVGAEVVDRVTSAVTAPRLWLEVGTLEGDDLLAENRRLRDQAALAGTDLTYREVTGGHDLATWRGGVADALAHLLSRGA